MRRFLYFLAFIVMFYASYFFMSCEKTCDKIDRQRYDRDKQQWIPLDSTKEKQ